jgi:hypothetical protein
MRTSPGVCPVADKCEYGNELPVCIKSGQISLQYERVSAFQEGLFSIKSGYLSCYSDGKRV